MMKTHRDSTVAVARGILTAAVALTLWVGAPRALGALPVNPGFEGPANVVDIGTIVYPLIDSQWGVESAFVTGSINGITPYAGSNMLQMTSGGGGLSQAWQFINVGVGSGRTANLSGFFTADITNALAYIRLLFYASPNSDGSFGDGWDSPISLVGTPYMTVTTAGTWYEASLSNVAVPASTTWVGVEMGFQNPSLGGEGSPNSGYADGLNFSIVPEPATWALLAGGFGALFFFMRRRRGMAV